MPGISPAQAVIGTSGPALTSPMPRRARSTGGAIPAGFAKGTTPGQPVAREREWLPRRQPGVGQGPVVAGVGRGEDVDGRPCATWARRAPQASHENTMVTPGVAAS